MINKQTGINPFKIVINISICIFIIAIISCQNLILLSEKDFNNKKNSDNSNNSSTISKQSWTFNFTGSQQNWIVQAGVTKIRITATGAAGGLAGGGTPGAGGQMIAEFNVVTADTYYIFVGGDGGSPGGLNMGWNGGGLYNYSTNYGVIGGGATDIRHGGTALTDRIMIVGGGGGVGANGGNAGGYGAGTLNANGGVGQNQTDGDGTQIGGGGGTQTSGGTAGTGGFTAGIAGALGIGAQSGSYGGAGGGGYYGGGSGGAGILGGHAAGGGGSSYLNTGLGTYISGTDGFNSTTDGSVIIQDITP